MGLSIVQVRALNALAAELPGITEVRFRGEDGEPNTAVRVGESGGWMLNPPGAPECVSLGHQEVAGRCVYCREAL